MKKLSKKLIGILIKKKLRISIAESCTGGLLSSSLTGIAGSSKAFDFGIVTYSNKSKIKMLNVSKKLINKYGAVSEQVCYSMVKNLSNLNNSQISISITGIAGPGGSSKNKPVGLVYIGLKKGKKISIKKYLFKNKGRQYIQRASVKKSLSLISNIIK